MAEKSTLPEVVGHEQYPALRRHLQNHDRLMGLSSSIAEQDFELSSANPEQYTPASSFDRSSFYNDLPPTYEQSQATGRTAPEASINDDSNLLNRLSLSELSPVSPLGNRSGIPQAITNQPQRYIHSERDVSSTIQVPAVPRARLTNPVVIPPNAKPLGCCGRKSFSSSPTAHFPFAYSVELQQHSIAPASFRQFLNGLNVLFANNSSSLTPSTQISEFLASTNHSLFRPNNLNVRLCGANELLDILNFPGSPCKRACTVATLSGKYTDASKKLKALKPYVSELVFEDQGKAGSFAGAWQSTTAAPKMQEVHQEVGVVPTSQYPVNAVELPYNAIRPVELASDGMRYELPSQDISRPVELASPHSHDQPQLPTPTYHATYSPDTKVEYTPQAPPPRTSTDIKVPTTTRALSISSTSSGSSAPPPSSQSSRSQKKEDRRERKDARKLDRQTRKKDRKTEREVRKEEWREKKEQWKSERQGRGCGSRTGYGGCCVGRGEEQTWLVVENLR